LFFYECFPGKGKDYTRLGDFTALSVPFFVNELHEKFPGENQNNISNNATNASMLENIS